MAHPGECLLTAGAAKQLLHLAINCLTVDEYEKFSDFISRRLEKHDREHPPYNAGDVSYMYDEFVSGLEY